ncbi:GNAT family protein [Ferrimicrobium sp.]|uniref:GNAT family N-acetyltransferase n=1 Tax=Ferrimicrobium sp. TaxID=2926050 RepID=UPI00260FE9D6|nr:GNAT family protein [Ferrimicrobium sp.]
MMSDRDSSEGFQFALPEMQSAGWLRCRLIEESDVPRLFEAVTASQAHLRPWMPWAATDYTQEMAEELVAAQTRRGGELVTEAIYIPCNDEHPFLGCFGLHARVGKGALEIGYWVDVRYTRRGVATLAAALLTEAAFSVPGVDRVEIHHDEANHASAGVPQRLGYAIIGSCQREPEAPGEVGVERQWRMRGQDWPSSAGAQLLAKARD